MKTQTKDETSTYANVTNAKLFYKIYGTGEPIIIVHGGPGLDQSYLIPQLLELSNQYQLIFYDQRGSGNSLQDTDDLSFFNINTFVEDLEHLRVHLNLEKFIILGHSWGGYLSMNYAAKYAKNLNGIILLNTAPADYEGQLAFANSFKQRTKNIEQDLIPLFSYNEFVKLNINEITNLYTKLFSTYLCKPNDINLINFIFKTDSAKSGFKVMSEMSKKDWICPGIDLFPSLQKLNIQTLIIHGQEDIVPLWTIEKIHSTIKPSSLHIIKNCGHFSFAEHTLETKSLISDFLAHLNLHA